VLLSIALLISGCASNQSLSSRDRAAIRRVAVDHAISNPEQDAGNTSNRLAARVLKRGASYGLGFLGLGIFGGLALDAADLGTPAKTGEISKVALRILAEARTDPGELLAARMEKELARNGFVVSSKTPDAVIRFELQRLTLIPADDLKLKHKPALTVRATMVDSKNRTLWRHSAAEVADESAALTWHEYASHPQRLRAEFDKLAARLAQHLVAEIKR
jgi:hypothetical protein